LLERATAQKKRLYGEFILYTKIKLKGREKGGNVAGVDTTLTKVGEERDQDRSPDLFVPETGRRTI
jgi:hypothetical protein